MSGWKKTYIDSSSSSTGSIRQEVRCLTHPPSPCPTLPLSKPSCSFPSHSKQLPVVRNDTEAQNKTEQKTRYNLFMQTSYHNILHITIWFLIWYVIVSYISSHVLSWWSISPGSDLFTIALAHWRGGMSLISGCGGSVPFFLGGSFTALTELRESESESVKLLFSFLGKNEK